MSSFKDNSITENGRDLLSEIELGAVFTPTRIVIGSGFLPEGITTRTITDVVSPVKSLSINKKKKNKDGNVIFGCAFSNEDVTEEFFYRELGLYAKAVKEDGSETAEILYSYGNAGEDAELMAGYSSATLIERQIDIIVYIGNDAKVNLEIESGIYATKEDVRKTGQTADAAGTSTDITLSTHDNTKLEDGDSFVFKIPFDIGENASISVNGSEFYPVYTPAGKTVPADFVTTGAYVHVRYNAEQNRWYISDGDFLAASEFDEYMTNVSDIIFEVFGITEPEDVETATDEEVEKMLDEEFSPEGEADTEEPTDAPDINVSDDLIATDDEVEKMLNNIFNSL